MTVRYWSSHNDANHNNSHAECQGIEFFAFPYQSYYARVGNTSAMVGNLGGNWGATVYDCQPDGRTKYFANKGFGKQDKDAAFEYAATQVLEREKLKEGGWTI